MKHLARYLIVVFLLVEVVGAQNIPDMLKRVMPGVVTVTIQELDIKGETYIARLGFAGNASRDEPRPYSPYYKFAEGIAASGSGFIIEAGGRKLVVTNAHVVELAKNGRGISCISIAGNTYFLKLLGMDTYFDIAVLEFRDPPGEEFAALFFAEEEPRVGEQVFSIGTPSSKVGLFQYTVTNGIVSGLQRAIPGFVGRQDFVQHTAVITHGNSGGPLVNVSGKVVGVNAAGLGNDQMSELPMFNFAVSSGTVERVVEDVVKYGMVQRVFLGLHIVKRVKKSFFFKEWDKIIDSLPRIQAVFPGSPAFSKASSLEGKSVTAINGIPMSGLENIITMLESMKPGDEVRLTVKDDEGTTNDVVISTGVQDKKVYKQFAVYMFQRYAGVSVGERGGDVVVKRVMAQRKKIIKKNIRPAKLTVGSKIVVIGGNEQKLWNIENLADVGKMFRIFGRRGLVSLYIKKGNSFAILKFKFRNEDGYTEQSLLY